MAESPQAAAAEAPGCFQSRGDKNALPPVGLLEGTVEENLSAWHLLDALFLRFSPRILPVEGLTA